MKNPFRLPVCYASLAPSAVPQCRHALAVGALLLASASPGLAEVIYNNSTNDLSIRFNTGALEVGDQIVLTGTARYLTNFSFEYWGTGTNADRFTGDVEACVRFYLNDGAEFQGFRTPGKKFYDSRWFSVQATERSVLVFSAGADLGPQGLFLPASEFTWTVQFRGMAGADQAGVDLYGPLVAGLGYPDYWERTFDGWQLKTNQSTAMNFAAVLEAGQTPIRSVPALQIDLFEGNAIVSWPDWAADYELLASPQVGGTGWSLVGSGIYAAGSRFVMTNSITPGSMRFFRLHRSQ